ncbi:MAG: hypothetical protein Q9219_000611 [cf. Caloplaca sp. 3 TL-2023]
MSAAAAASEDSRTTENELGSELPPALRVGQSSSERWANDVPAPYRTSSELTPRSSSESQRSRVTQDFSTNPQPQPTNPYLRNKNAIHHSSQPVPNGNENSTAVWANEPEAGLAQPDTSRDQPRSPTELLNSLGTSTIPRRPSVSELDSYPNQSGENPALPSRLDTSESSGPWHQERGQSLSRSPIEPQEPISYAEELRELVSQPFGSPPKDSAHPIRHEKPLPDFPDDLASSNHPEMVPGLVHENPIESSDMAPHLPPRPQGHETRSNDQGLSSARGGESQQAKIREQRNQTYQIRHVNWFDASSAVNPRRSPIMVQNANGPCPLLALVNALVLSTSADTATGLVETLRVREQISLGLLLEAVIDELMSRAPGDTAQPLPDVSDLYAFLINLHTGMNVNPQFVEPTSSSTHLLDAPNDESAAGSQDNLKPGGFEDSPFMRLYSTFSISLIHGWLPRATHPVCASLRRTATTYEDAQSLLFAEEDLETKLQAQGLTVEEQRLLEDISSVKHFLTTSPTQLTEYGLDIISRTLRPGAIAILFRNDHFSTLYKQPRSGQIFTLVTDMGYAGHDEVVWESLVDISGEGAEFFSGDFRPVGNNVPSGRRSGGPDSAADDAGWTTVSRGGAPGRSRGTVPESSGHGRTQPASVSNAFSQLSVGDDPDAGLSAKVEQEDQDLALALLLQEEEEERERQDNLARRRREDELSQQYIKSSNRSSQRGSRPQIPPRGGGGARGGPIREQAADDDLPPPTYEQAAKRPVYKPPKNSHHHAQVPLRTNIDRTGAQASRPNPQVSAYSQTNAAYANANGPQAGMRRPAAEKKGEKDCVVM